MPTRKMNQFLQCVPGETLVEKVLLAAVLALDEMEQETSEVDDDMARRYAYAAELLEDLLEGRHFNPDVPTTRERE